MKGIIGLIAVISVFFQISNGWSIISEKKIIAVPSFVVEGGLPAPLGKDLSLALIASFEKSGKIEPKGEDDISKLVKNLEDKQSLSGASCKSDEACLLRIGKAADVDYIASCRISKAGDNIFLSVRLIKIKDDEVDIATILKQTTKESELVQVVTRMGEEIAMRIPLEGRVIVYDSATKDVVINLGSSNSLSEGDEFFVEKEKGLKDSKGRVQFSDRQKIGKLRLLQVQSKKSKGKILSSEGAVSEGDFVKLDQDELMKRLERDRKEEEKRIKKMQEIKDDAREREREEEEKRQKKMRQKEEDARSEEQSKRDAELRKPLFESKSPFLRAGYGGFGLIQLGDSTLNKYYKDGKEFLIELDFLRLRGYNGNGFDLFTRYAYRKFGMNDASFNEFKASPPALGTDEVRTYPLSKSTLTLHGFDLGTRYAIGHYFLFERWDVYISCAYRLLYAVEKAESGLIKNLWASGVIFGAGIELTLIPNMGIFAEYQNGYTPTGKSKRNVEGSQVLFGATLRSEATKL